ncbi:MAG: hypothetical protein JJ975_14910 [Bacteroidia bacterium]|nr:hypothetical protein [Bacteroidia bacterium]
MKNDLEFAKEVRAQQKLVEGLKAVGASRMAAEVKAGMTEWKVDGYSKYTPSSGMQPWVKVVLGTVVVGAIAAAAYFFMPHKKKHVAPEIEKPETESPAQPDQKGGSVEGEGLVKLKTTETSEAEIKIDVQDPTTFEVNQIGNEGGVYTYEIKYDGTTQVVKTPDPGLAERLREQASNALTNTSEDVEVAPVDSLASH